MKVRISDIHKIVRGAISRHLDEVRYIDTTAYYRGKNGNAIAKRDPDQVLSQDPIKNTDVIRVFHGCDLKTAVRFAKEGLSGQQWQPRKYSYEMGMNPIGLFVSTDFNKVKEFSNPFDSGKNKHAAVIIEFSARASDLDTPVWNNSESYFCQGSNPQPFIDKADRERQRDSYQAAARQSEYGHVRNSDNPAMADNIFNNSEHQALFLGNLDPNMIKRFWVTKFDNRSGYYIQSGDYQPMNRRDFLKEYGDEDFYDRRDGQGRDVYTKIRSDKLFNPNEDFTSFEDMAKRFGKWDAGHNPKARQRKVRYYGSGEAADQHLVDAMKWTYDRRDMHMFQQMMWPKQLRQLFGDEEYEQYFDKYGIASKRQQS